MRFILACAVLLSLAACGSSPKVQFYVLDVVPGTRPVRPPATVPLTVAAVHLPASLDRQEMVLMTGTTAVHVSDRDRWSAPLGRMTRRVLTQDLAARLGKTALVLADSPAAMEATQIVVTLDQFGPDATGRVVLDGDWSVVAAGASKPRLFRHAHVDGGVAKNGADVAAEMSRVLGRLADDMAAVLAGSADRG